MLISPKLLNSWNRKLKRKSEIYTGNTVCYLPRHSGIEFSTFFVRQRVAKASSGLLPPPFSITYQNEFELRKTNIGRDFLKILVFIEKFIIRRPT